MRNVRPASRGPRLLFALLLAAGLAVGGSAIAEGRSITFPVVVEASPVSPPFVISGDQQDIPLTSVQPRSAVVLTGSHTVTDKKGRELARLAPGVVLIEATLDSRTVYCGIAPRSQPKKHVGEQGICGQDADGDGAFEELVLDRHPNGMWTAFDFSMLSSHSATPPVGYRRLGPAETPVLEMVLRHLREQESGFGPPRYRHWLNQMLLIPESLRARDVTWATSAEIIPPRQGRRARPIKPVEAGLHRFGAYEASVTDPQDGLTVEIVSEVPSRAAQLTLAGFTFHPIAPPSRATMLTLTEVQP